MFNEQFALDCDFAVAVFWTRIGTPTNNYESGTIEEIERLLSSGKDVFLYFSDCPISPSQINNEQYIGVIKTKEKYKHSGLFYQYNSYEDFKKKFTHNISKYMESYFPSISDYKLISADNLFINRKDVNQIIKKAKNDIFVSGVSLYAVASSLIVDEKINSDIQIRLLCTRSDALLIREQCKLSNYNDNDILERKKKSVLQQLKTMYFSGNRFPNLHVKEIDAVIPIGFIGIDLDSIDGFIHIQHYLYKTHPNQGPH